jgi:hypothetical protein
MHPENLMVHLINGPRSSQPDETISLAKLGTVKLVCDNINTKNGGILFLGLLPHRAKP